MNQESQYISESRTRSDMERWQAEREHALREFRNYIDDNNPPILEELQKRIETLVKYRYSIDDLLNIVNAKIDPFEVTNVQDSKVVVTKIEDIINLKMINTKGSNSAPVNLPSEYPIKLQSINYNVTNGIFSVLQYPPVAIAVNNKARRNDGSEYNQCRLMRLLFKSVKSQKTEVKYTTFFSVSEAKLSDKNKSQIKNYIDQINKKVSDKTPIDKLIKMQKNRFFINNSYL
jgi:hypothetical protein